MVPMMLRAATAAIIAGAPAGLLPIYAASGAASSVDRTGAKATYIVSCRCATLSDRERIAAAIGRLGGSILYRYSAMPGLAVMGPSGEAGAGFMRAILAIRGVTDVRASSTSELQTPKPATSVLTPVSFAPEVRLSGSRVVLPIVMVEEFPFVEGAIAGVKGKLMLDTGARYGITINDHRVPLVGGQSTGTGHFGSGETFAVRTNAAVGDVTIGSLHFPTVTHVKSQDATQLEGITPDFIGWFGYDAWQGYAFKLDYRRNLATFYKGAPAEYLAGERVIAALPFKTRKLPNHPVTPVGLGKTEGVAAFDTGQYGTLYVDDATKAALIAQGVLKPTKDPERYDLSGLTIDGKPMPGVPDLYVHKPPFAAAAPIGLDEKVVLTIGYGFLRQFKTVWDYERKSIYLLGA